MLNPFISYSKLSDEALMKRLQNRDNKALEELYNRYYKKLYYFSIKMLNNDRETANDIVQDVFLKLVESPEKFNPEYKFKSWIYTVTANECRKLFRLKSLQNIENQKRQSQFKKKIILKVYRFLCKNWIDSWNN